MRLALFGSSGGTGRHVLAQALAAGHAVTALVRDASAVPARPGLTIVVGSAHDAACVGHVVAGKDAVLCALGGHPLRRRERVCSTAMRHIVAAMEEAGVRRVIAISTFGAGDTRPQAGWLARHALFGFVLRSEVADKEAMEEVLAASGLDWTVVRIGVLKDEPGHGRWRVSDDGSIRGLGTVPRADVAAFMLAQLHDPAWIRRRPVLMS